VSKKDFDIEFFADGVDLTQYVRDVSLERETTVRYTPYRYTGWRRWWRRLTFRPLESDTYEFEAVIAPNEPFLSSGDDADVTGFSYSVKPTSDIRKVD
jgi:hypothetical protein